MLCELGRADEAVKQVSHLSLSVGGAARVKLAMANTYLSKCLQRVSHGHDLDWRTLHTSLELFMELRHFPFPHSYFGKISHLSVLLGIAFATHLEGKVDSALKAWQSASHA